MATARSSLQNAGPQKWVSGRTYGLDAIVWSPACGLTYRRIVAGVGTTDPCSDNTNWTIHGATRPRQTLVVAVSVAGASGVGNTFSAPISVTNPSRCRWRAICVLQGGSPVMPAAACAITTTQVTLTLLMAHSTSAVYHIEIQEDY